jgi:hypothetical protein
MELWHLIRFLLSFDNRWLLPLRHWVPDFQQVVNFPKETFQSREIEIGPWTHFVKSRVFPTLLIIPVVAAILLTDSPAVTIGSTLAWLLLAGALVHSGRGGRCFLQAKGVELHYRGVMVFCPWDLFHIAGRPIYYAEKQRLDLPVVPAALANIEVWKNESIIAVGLDAKASHFKAYPTGEIRLKFIYGVNPEEFGFFLLELGRNLGRASEVAKLEGAPLAPLTVRSEEGGWIRVSLTRLRFPPNCCDCGQATDRWQKFRGYSSFFSKSVNEFMEIVAPVCSNCQSFNRGHYWRTLFKTTLMVVIAVTTISFLVGVVLDLCGLTPAPGAMTVIMTFCGLIASLGLAWFFAEKRARAASTPLSLTDYRPGDGTICVRFRNGKYAELFLAAR